MGDTYHQLPSRTLALHKSLEHRKIPWKSRVHTRGAFRTPRVEGGERLKIRSRAPVSHHVRPPSRRPHHRPRPIPAVRRPGRLHPPAALLHGSPRPSTWPDGRPVREKAASARRRDVVSRLPRPTPSARHGPTWHVPFKLQPLCIYISCIARARRSSLSPPLSYYEAQAGPSSRRSRASLQA